MSLVVVLGLVSVVVSSSAASAADDQFITFDPTGSRATRPVGINDSGVVAGWYADRTGVHGFVRAADDTVTSFDVPGSRSTTPAAINNAGVVTGLAGEPAFVRATDGTITEFDVQPGIDFTRPADINDAGVITGHVGDSGFVRAVDGTFATFFVPGADFVIPTGINASGTVAGHYLDPSDETEHGFLRAADGTITKVDVPDAESTLPLGINDSGVIVGKYQDAAGRAAFLRTAAGIFTTFEIPGATSISPAGINNSGVVTGSFVDGRSQGFVRAADGTITKFDPPGSTGTFPVGINNSGVITGSYSDATGRHGFVRTDDDPPKSVVYVSSASRSSVDGIAAGSEDILKWHGPTDTWSIHFDGSDVGLGAVNVNAFHIVDDGDPVTADAILLSVTTPISVGGLDIDDSDIVKFVPTSVGATTAGTFELFFDGSEFGLTAGQEDINALAFTADGRLIVSTTGRFIVPAHPSGTLRGPNKDAIVLESSGRFSRFFDGSDVTLTKNGEELVGLSFDAASSELFGSTKGDFKAGGLTGDRDDIWMFGGATGEDTSGRLKAFWDGDARRFGNENVDGLYVEPAED